MTAEPAEIEQALSNLNDIVFKAMAEDDDDYKLLSLRSGSDGMVQWVEFCGQPLWDSENDERFYNEETDMYEPLEAFLRRQMVTVGDRMAELVTALKA